jgi:hypothetical protein
MSSLQLKIVAAALFVVIIFVTGFWVSKSGKPVNLIKMNIHKFIALGAAIFVGVIIYQVRKGTGLSPLEIGVLVAAVLFAIATIITGGLASLAKPIQVAVIIHKITPYLTVLSTATSLYLLAFHAG